MFFKPRNVLFNCSCFTLFVDVKIISVLNANTVATYLLFHITYVNVE